MNERSTVIRAMIIGIFFACSFSHAMEVNDLRCEYRANPLGIDAIHPRLSWVLKSEIRAQKQTAFQVIVAGSQENLLSDKGDMWDTGKILSSQSIQVKYHGRPLQSGVRYFWKVKVWDQNDHASDWSDPAWWEMSLLDKQAWKGDWISDGKTIPEKEEAFYVDDPAPLFRKNFQVDKSVRRARLYITGLGYYEAYVNGKRVGDCLLDPGWTNYSKRILYHTYDVTGSLNEGDNCVGVTLGNGWYNPLPLRLWGRLNLRDHLPVGRPAFIAQLNIEYADGCSEWVFSDSTWKVHDGPLLRNNIYLGEVYDARKEVPGWNRPDFDDKAWGSATKANEPGGILQSQFQPPIKKTAVVRPVKIDEPAAGVYIFDMGQNFSGWVTLKLRAAAGTRVKLRFGELLYDDGRLNPMTSVCGQIKGRRGNGESTKDSGAPATAWQQNIYIASGNGLEVYTPRFTWQAFRYVEVTGYPGKPGLDSIEGLRLNSDVEPAGTFSCSNDLFNQIQTMVQWTFLSNLFSVQSDCPHRERFGYGGDLAVTSEAFMMNYDMAQFYTKAVRDFADSARDNGMFTDTAPFVGIQYCGLGWAMAHPQLLLQLYQYYGDQQLIEEQYAAAARWFELVQQANPDYLIKKGLSDHESLTARPAEAMVTPLYYQTAVTMARLSGILGKQEQAEHYLQLAANIQQAYNQKYLDKRSGRFGPGTQASQSFAIYCGLVPAEQKQASMNYLVDDIVNKHDGHLTTGIFGTKYMLDILSRYGKGQTAFDIVNQEDFPGWGNMIKKGATTLWEHWAFSDNTFSHNHPMFGSVSEWFYKHAAGIDIGPDAVGFDTFTIYPKLTDTLDWAKATYRSVHGEIVCNWEKSSEGFCLDVTVPIGTAATVYIPTEKSRDVFESGVPASHAEGIQFIRYENNHAVYRAASGIYHFTVKSRRH